MSEKHPIRNGVISTVVGGVILAVLGQIWPPARALLKWMVGLLVAVVPLPAWLLGLLILATALFVRWATRGPRASPPLPQPDAIDTSTPTLVFNTPVEPIERQILERLVKADGGGVSPNALVRATGAQRLRLEAELERLQASNIVEMLDDPDEGTTEVFLTPRGKQYAIQLGLL